MLLAMAMLAACAANLPASPGPVGVATGPSREQIHWIPVTDAAGDTRLMYTRVCRPAGDEATVAVIINHGKPPMGTDRDNLKPASCTAEAVRWFTDRSYVAVIPVRRGYGATGGPMAESDTDCAASPRDYTRSAKETARDIDAAVHYAASLPYVRRSEMVVVGQSVGGLGAIAYAAANPPLISAIVNFAGGAGGHIGNLPNNNCQPERLATATGIFGRTARTPMLWIYTENDSYFAPAIARAMWQAFTNAGGNAELRQLGPFDGDGHMLFRHAGGSQVWGGLVEVFIKHGALPPQAFQLPKAGQSEPLPATPQTPPG